MTKITTKIVLQGNPTPQARCRTFYRSNKVCTYDPQSQLKMQLKQQVREQLHEFYQMPNYPKITFWFLMPIPKSMHRIERELANTGMLKHVKKPDIDNLVKLYLDVLTGIAYHDDNCVALGRCTKLYSQIPRTIIFIEETEKLITNAELANG